MPDVKLWGEFLDKFWPKKEAESEVAEPGPEIFDVCIDGENRRIEGFMRLPDLKSIMSGWVRGCTRCSFEIEIDGVRTITTLDLEKVTSMVATPKVEKNEPSQPTS